VTGRSLNPVLPNTSLTACLRAFRQKKKKGREKGEASLQSGVSLSFAAAFLHINIRLPLENRRRRKKKGCEKAGPRTISNRLNEACSEGRRGEGMPSLHSCERCIRRPETRVPEGEARMNVTPENLCARVKERREKRGRNLFICIRRPVSRASLE